MTLKRVTKQKSTPATGLTETVKSSSFITRQAGGLCFDFNPKDSNM